MRFARFLFLTALLIGSREAAGQRLEALWYLRGEASIQSFLAHADQISIIAPQVFQMDSAGIITGRVDPRVIAKAREMGVKLMPLVMNPGFDQPAIHRVLNNPGARAQALRSLTALCRDNKFDGIQFELNPVVAAVSTQLIVVSGTGLICAMWLRRQAEGLAEKRASVVDRAVNEWSA